MTTELHTIESAALGRPMQHKTYGTRGRGVLVFPSQDGRCTDYENFHMTDVLAPLIDAGRIRLICVDSIDGETWSAKDRDEHERILRHEQWVEYIVRELIPAVTRPGEQLIVTGCSMGGYHAVNFLLRFPHLFSTVLSLSGLFHATFFFGDYHDPLVYDNSPIDYLPGMPADHPFLAEYRRKRIILCVGQGPWEDDLLWSTRRLGEILAEKQVPAWVDVWGTDVAHDWPWWRRQVVYFMEKILSEQE